MIITAGRSGSNLLLSLLDSHPRIVHHGEIFGPTKLSQPETRRDILDRGALAYFVNSFQRKGFEVATGSKFLYSYFRDAYVERNQPLQLDLVYDYLIHQNDIRIIHLIRRNPVRVVVSFQIANKTGEFVSLKEGAKQVKISITPEELQDRINKIERERQWAADTFSSHPFYEIYFEDLVHLSESKRKELLAFIGVDDFPLSARTKRINNRPLADMLENHAELKAHFKGDRIGALLDD